MAEPMTYYLIDFENVGVDGIDCAQHLGADSCVHLFSTRNAAKISTATLASFNTTTLKVHEVPQGGQSVDMHIVSYLGFLIGRDGKESKYVIVSKDTDYDRIIQFWDAECRITILRQEKLAQPPKKAPESKAAPKTTVPAKNPSPSKVSGQKAVSGQEKTALNAAVQQALSKAGYNSETVCYIASQAVKNIGKANAKQAVYQAGIEKYGQKYGLDIYNRIKKML